MTGSEVVEPNSTIPRFSVLAGFDTSTLVESVIL